MSEAAIININKHIIINTIIEDLGLPTYDELEEANLDYFATVRDLAEEEAIKECMPEDDAVEEGFRAEGAAQRELYGKWHSAVIQVAEELYGEHGLELEAQEAETYGCLPYMFEVKPTVSWRHAADQIRETINGVGYFHFDTLEGFLDSGPYSAQEAVMRHLHWIKWFPEVYASGNTKTMYHEAMR